MVEPAEDEDDDLNKRDSPKRRNSPEIIDLSDDDDVGMDSPTADASEAIIQFKHVYIGTLVASVLQPSLITLNESCLQFSLTVNCQNSISCKFLYKDLPLVVSHFSTKFCALILFLNEHLKSMIKDKIYPTIKGSKRSCQENFSCVAFVRRLSSNGSGEDCLERRRIHKISAKVASLLLDKTKYKCISEEKAKDIINRLTTNNDDNGSCLLNGPLLIYPKSGHDKISISQDDLKCLVGNAFLNDVIIGFYCRYLYNEVLSDKGRLRNHVFDSIFLDKLVKTHNQIAENPESSEERLKSLKKWIKCVNFSDKHFLFFPANQSFHWFLIVICFPCLLFSEQEPDDLEQYESPRPLILILDSMNTYSVSIKDAQNCTVYGRIQTLMSTFIQCICGSARNLPTYELRVPKQSNNTDCGLFVLEYLQRFFSSNPLTDFSDPFPDLSNWFDPVNIRCTRQHIFDLIQEKISDS